MSSKPAHPTGLSRRLCIWIIELSTYLVSSCFQVSILDLFSVMTSDLYRFWPTCSILRFSHLFLNEQRSLMCLISHRGPFVNSKTSKGAWQSRRDTQPTIPPLLSFLILRLVWTLHFSPEFQPVLIFSFPVRMVTRVRDAHLVTCWYGFFPRLNHA